MSHETIIIIFIDLLFSTSDVQKIESHLNSEIPIRIYFRIIKIKYPHQYCTFKLYCQKFLSYKKLFFSNNNQPLFSIEGKNKIDIPLKKWQHMLSDNTGKQIGISISVWNESYPEGIQYKSFPVYITTDSIDPYIAYRLIEPGYESWHEMDIRQRALNCFKRGILSYPAI